MRAARLALGGALVALVASTASVVPATATVDAAPAVAAAPAALPDLAPGKGEKYDSPGKKGKKGTGKKKGGFVPPNGAMLSDPLGPEPRAILTRVNRTIKNTGKKQTIRIAVWNFADKPTANSLIKAHQRGVHVQIVVAGSVANPQWSRVAAALNRNKKDKSFARKCRGACRSKSKIMHSKVFLFSSVRGKKNISMFGSANLTTPAGNRQWNDMVTTTSPRLYEHFVQLFTEYAKDKPVKKVYKKTEIGRYRVYLWPNGKNRNSILEEFQKVRCTGAKNMPGGRTVVRIAVAGWFDAFGTAIAKRVRRLWDQGCDVKVITTLAGRGINQTLKNGRGRGPVPIRRLEIDNNGDGVAERYLHMKAVSIRGVYEGNRNAKVVLTGSPNWSTRAARSDEVLIRDARAGGMAAKYARHIDRLYSSPYAHLRLKTPLQLRKSVSGGGFARRGGLPSWFELD